jgi:uncharacterized protein YdgA (DUF945 family)
MKRRLIFYGIPLAIIAFLVWAAKPWYGGTDVASSSTQAIAEIEQLSRPLRTALFQHWAQNEYSPEKSYHLEEFELRKVWREETGIE